MQMKGGRACGKKTWMFATNRGISVPRVPQHAMVGKPRKEDFLQRGGGALLKHISLAPALIFVVGQSVTERRNLEGTLLVGQFTSRKAGTFKQKRNERVRSRKAAWFDARGANHD